MNTQILDMIISTVAAAMILAISYMVAKITMRIAMKKTREEREMLYDLLNERDDELRRYHQMFGPLKDWEDSEWVEKSQSLFGEENNVKGEYLTPQQIDERYKGMGPDEDDELPF